MKVFEVSLNDNIHNEWNIVLSQNVDKMYDLIRKIENDEEISINKDERIQMHLINIETNKKDRVEIPYESDILYWSNDITLGAYSPYKGIIISKNLKNILSKYNLPPHFLYPVEIVNTETLEINDDYYLFYSIGKMIDLTLFNESEYTYFKRRKEIRKSIGDFDSYEDFDKEYDRVFDKESIKIKITKRVISTDYDLISSSLNYLCVKENFLVEKENLKGVVFKYVENIVVKKDVDEV
uniref:hypothetical protein n=1 Tax=uncultured Tenacibaculum sp. TaxID=174713 RepID=UPI002607BFC5|nr:hypothetical protein [uncultured Tenacibaculum sp.]